MHRLFFTNNVLHIHESFEIREKRIPFCSESFSNVFIMPLVDAGKAEYAE